MTGPKVNPYLLAADPHGRAATCRREIDLAQGWKTKAGRWLDLYAQGLRPECITDNDTKFNPVMLEPNGKARNTTAESTPANRKGCLARSG